ncbi:beta-aspartyl-peptidase [Agarivorans sp. B2Z047]|uniref:beta-aspartyl-peptidase n=1 Tax=Agarivorans sp. B2Z047 TaxID=2652721 RepID=UPI00128DDE3B|nr:beta-aspartyl-peptidase [Agarivorans sp. B2Z047]MPW27629.1 beta-aspartyl-peptidase [Agarivorans sp. B2Z047]UQN44531.1 beta-aspartyl-peptidase [Agarivorans sp. B2Z047]
MLTLLKNAQVYAPEALGLMDVLLANGSILQLAPNIELKASHGLVDSIDLSGSILAPGFVDALVHFTGGGGEGGFAYRTAELSFEDAAPTGVTSLVGALGTDSVTRTPAQVLGKARELSAMGLSCYCYTGSYHLPVKTITGSIEQDIVLIPEMIGVGELAIADHRASQASVQAFSEVVAEARVAGLLAGKKGISFFHVGDGKGKLNLLREIVKQSDLSITQLYPTHCNRNQALFNDALAFLSEGGAIDFTTSTIPQFIEEGEVSCPQALKTIIDKGLDWQRVSFSSDANASLPLFDDAGELVGMQAGKLESLYLAAKEAVQSYQVPLDIALSVISRNPAKILGLKNKGQLAVGFDADLVVLDQQSLAIKQVFAKGQSIWAD